MLGDFDGDQPGVSHRAPDERHLTHIGKPQVANILPTPTKESIILFPPDSRADTLVFFFFQGLAPYPNQVLLTAPSGTRGSLRRGCHKSYYHHDHRNTILFMV